MTRRDFFNTLARLLGLIALPAAARAGPPRQLIQRCPLAGFEHHDGDELWSYLTVGDSLELVREPGNPHDGNAIRIDWLGRKLGYLPRSHNAATARLLDQGKRLEARIGGLKSSVNPWHRVSVEVWQVG
ncbi:MAG: HIRAN domain-containing protein [Gallionellaceae bacterium]|nr:HIRAN domain-containing protein [Gallionellaceae bacterium]